MSVLINEAGARYGRLTVLERAENSSRNFAQWLCTCDCGEQCVVLGIKLRNGRVQSCGCLRTELLVARSVTHGLSSHPLYTVWCSMIQRCEYTNGVGWKNYGGRGISVCERWRNSFEAFLQDTGPRPGPGYSIDRVDPDGNYEPGNVRWATPKEQRLNRRGSTKGMASESVG